MKPEIVALILAANLPTGEGGNERLTLLLRRIGRIDFETLRAPEYPDCIEVSCKTKIGEKETPIQALTRGLVEQYNAYVANMITLLSEPRLVYQSESMAVYGKVISPECFSLYARQGIGSGGLVPVTELDFDDIVEVVPGSGFGLPESKYAIAMPVAEEIRAVEAAFVVLAAENAI